MIKNVQNKIISARKNNKNYHKLEPKEENKNIKSINSNNSNINKY